MKSKIKNNKAIFIVKGEIPETMVHELSKKINHLEDILVFDNYHLHTATNRKEYGTIRKSVDVRILPIDYDDTQNKKSLGGVEMKPGGYFSRRPISHE